MGCVVAHVSDQYRLDLVAAQQLWNWLLRRQGLSPETRLTSVADIADASLGLHSARLPSPFATVLARNHDESVALSLFSAATRRRVTTVRCMRKTLHALPLKLAASAHAATLRFRERDALRMTANAGMGARQVLRATDTIVRLLEVNGHTHHREIEARLVGRTLTRTAVRAALKVAWERGTLTYYNDMAGWNREHRKFCLTHVVYPGLDMAMNRQEATRQLFEAYFGRYGPASLRDAAWWSGLSRAAVTTAINETEREIVSITTPWTERPLYMFRDQFDEYAKTPREHCATGINFLAHEDVALKAYFESRQRYLGGIDPLNTFNRIGEALPVIVLDGRVLGTWRWDACSRVVSVDLLPSIAARKVRQAIMTRAVTLTSSLRAGFVTARDR